MGHKGGCWPNRYQEYLLKASLLKGKEAIDAWHEWKSNVDVDQLDMGSHRLLPLLYRNLHNQGVQDPLMAKFKGVYRYTWYKNQTSFHKMTAVLNELHNAGIRTMILKGAALAVLHYRDTGLRPMDDFDVLVHTEQALSAIDLLVKMGWSPQNRSLKQLTELYVSVAHSIGFKDASGFTLDFHWHVLSECCYSDADVDFWKDALTIDIHGLSTFSLNPTDLLLHVCIHGVSWSFVPPLRWIADAMMIINTSQPEIDWDRLVTQAQKRHLMLPLRDALNYLRDLLNAPVPLSILERAKNTHSLKKAEKLEYWAKIHLPRYMHVFPDYYSRYLRYSWMDGGEGLPSQHIGFLKFLQYSWGLDNLWQVPLYALYKGLRFIRQTRFWYVFK